MKKVYIVNKGAHDHSDAKRYGELIFLSEGLINRYATGKMYREFAPMLENSGPHDYILITGLTVMSVVACSIFARIHGRLNLLLYKTQSGESCYVERKMVIDELIEKVVKVED